MKLLYLGAPRTATNSLWDSLSQHENIAGSRVKEIFNEDISKDLHLHYLKYFDINANTKYIIDGTPFPYCYRKSIVEKIPFEKVVIYPVRNPYDRIYSTIKQQIITYSYYIKNKSENYYQPQYITGNSFYNMRIIEDIKLLPFYLDSINLNYAYDITDNVMITRFDNINLNEIFNFLDIKIVDIKMKHLNSLIDKWYSMKFKKIRCQVDEFWNREKRKISKIILNDLMKIRNKIYVEDWIEQANNILSDV